MKVAVLYNPLRIFAHEWETLADAARRMTRYDIGALPVFAGGDLVGIVTERDLARAVADGVDPGTATVDEHMTAEPFTVTGHTPARDAAIQMLGLGLRHLPVVDGPDVLGMLSIRDVLEALVWNPGAAQAATAAS